MSRAPPLSNNNRFSVLDTSEPEIDEDAQTDSEPLPLPSLPPCQTRRPKWEKRLPQKLVIRSLEQGPNCIMVPTHLKTTDTMEEAATEAMVDTGATGDFIDQEFVNQAKLPTRKLSQPVPVYNVDGTLNEAGSICEVVDVVMTYNGHSKRILLAVTRLGKQSMILGITWLKKHNPEIDFRSGTVKMTRCLPRCCIGCQTERKEERNAQRQDAQRINACRTSPLPAFVEDIDDNNDQPEMDSEPTESIGSEDFSDEPLEEGDRIWATGLFPEAEYIQATTTISQQLAEGFRRNSEPVDPDEHIPPHLRDFHSVFSKESFDELPEPKPWDHAVELVSDATPKSCKVYPLSASE